MFSIGLYLNYDPSHLLWMGIDPVEAVQALRRPDPPRPGQGHRARPRGPQPLRVARPGRRSATTRGTSAGGATGCPACGQVDWPTSVDALYEGGFDGRAVRRARGPDVGRHRGEGRDRPADRPRHPPTPAGGLMDTRPLLEVRGLVKEYPGVRALDGVDFDVRPGEVHCIVGPNGAGKSTLIKCISGVVEPDRRARSASTASRSPGGNPSAAIGAGVATIYQELDLVADLSVAHNIFLGHELRRRGFLDRARMRRETTALLAPGRPRGDLARHPGPRPAAGRPAGRVDRPVALARRAPPDHGRAVGDPRRQRDRDAVRRRPPAHRRGRRRRLHLAPARRDPPDRRPGHGAAARARRSRPGSRPARRPTNSSRTWSAASSSSSFPSEPSGGGEVLLEVRRAAAAPRREGRDVRPARRRGARHRRPGRRRPQRAAARDLRRRPTATPARWSSTAQRLPPGRPDRAIAAGTGAGPRGPQVPGAAARAGA